MLRVEEAIKRLINGQRGPVILGDFVPKDK